MRYNASLSLPLSFTLVFSLYKESGYFFNDFFAAYWTVLEFLGTRRTTKKMTTGFKSNTSIFVHANNTLRRIFARRRWRFLAKAFHQILHVFQFHLKFEIFFLKSLFSPVQMSNLAFQKLNVFRFDQILVAQGTVSRVQFEESGVRQFEVFVLAFGEAPLRL